MHAGVLLAGLHCLSHLLFFLHLCHYAFVLCAQDRSQAWPPALEALAEQAARRFYDAASGKMSWVSILDVLKRSGLPRAESLTKKAVRSAVVRGVVCVQHR